MDISISVGFDDVYACWRASSVIENATVTRYASKPKKALKMCFEAVAQSLPKAAKVETLTQTATSIADGYRRQRAKR